MFVTILEPVVSEHALAIDSAEANVITALVRVRVLTVTLEVTVSADPPLRTREFKAPPTLAASAITLAPSVRELLPVTAPRLVVPAPSKVTAALHTKDARLVVQPLHTQTHHSENR